MQPRGFLTRCPQMISNNSNTCFLLVLSTGYWSSVTLSITFEDRKSQTIVVHGCC